MVPETTWTATIPWQSSAVSFYAYSSNKSQSSIIADVASDGTQTPHDMSTLSLNNNSGSNYSWTPATGSVIVTSPGGTFAGSIGYPSLTNTGGAFSALNGAISGTGAVTILVTADVATEAGTNALNASTSWTSINIQPSGARTISGTVAGNLINFNGADNVTIDGLNTGGNSLIISNINTSSTATTLNFAVDATNNTIQNATITGSELGVSSAVIVFGTGTTTGNDGNTINNCSIGMAGANSPTQAIYSGGSTTNTTINNSGIIITNNFIFDFFGSGSTDCNGINAATGSNTWTISNNKFYQTATRAFSSTALTYSAIKINSGGDAFSISNNIIGFASSAGTGTTTISGSSNMFRGIWLSSVGTTTASNVDGNTINGIAQSTTRASTTDGSSCFIGIHIGTGLANAGNTTGNTIGGLTGTGGITINETSTTSGTAPAMGIYNFSSSNTIISNNNFGSISIGTGGSGTSVGFSGIRVNTASAATATISNNTIGGTTAGSITVNPANGQLTGIYNLLSLATISGNTIKNLVNAGANAGTGTSSSVIGIYVTNSGGTINTVSQNNIYSLSNSNTTAATSVTGIFFAGSTGANVIDRNFIHSFSVATNSTSAVVSGIYTNSSNTTANAYQNNMIRLGIDGAGASQTVGYYIYGVYDPIGVNNFYNNSIYIGGSGVVSAQNTFAFNSTNTNTRVFQDNIFINARSNTSGTGANYAVQVGGTSANPSGLTINYNIYQATGTGGVFGRFNAANVADLATWKTTVGQDANSIYSDPKFVAPAGTSSTVDLHIQPSVVTPAEGTGIAVASVTNDYDGQTRSGLTPVDIGADAGNFTSGDFMPPAITYSALTNTSSTANITLSGVTITDAGGIPTSGTLVPRIYYKKNSGSYFSQPGTLTSGTGTNGTWSFTIQNSDIGGVAVTDVISYYVIAQDLSGNIASNPSAGLVASNVNTVSTPPTTPNSYTIIPPPLSGTYTVGVGKTYATLTAAVSAYNVAGVSGAVTFSLTDASYANETYPISINATTGASATNTLTIKPTQSGTTFSGSNPTALIVLNGADFVTIDGSTSNTVNSICPITTVSRNLTFTNNSTSTTSAVIWLQTTSALDGATNDVIMNCNIAGSGNTQTLFGVGSGSNAISTTSLGTSNNSNSIINNNISATQYGIYSQGASAANKNSGTKINQNLINTAAPNNVQFNGIWVGFEDGVTISGNNVAGMSISSGDVAAISLGISPISYGFSTTTGNDVTNAIISNNLIGSITNTASNSAVGILINSVTSGTTNLINNSVYGPIVAPTTSTDLTAGIFLCGGTGTAIANFYYNSVSMTGTRGAATYGSFALAIGGANPTVNVKNNILYNAQTSSSTGSSYAIGVGYSTYTALTSDYNDLYTSTSSSLGLTGALSTSGTNQTFATWKSTTSKDASSKNADPLFISTTVLAPQSGSPALVAGTTSTGITTDITCAARSSTAPTLGAYEIPVQVVAINSVSTNPTGVQCAAIARTVTANITAGTTTVSAVTLYYSYNGGTATAATMTLATGSASTGTSTWTGNIPSATPANANVTWYVTATDAYTTKTSNGISYSDAPLTGVTATATTSVTTLCSGSPVTLTGTFNTTKFSENFEGSPTAQFTVAASAGTYTATKNTTYFSQGTSSVLFTTASTSASGTLTQTSGINLNTLNSAVFTFKHIAAMESGFDYGYPEYSTDGGTTWITFPSTSYTGTASTSVFTGGNVRFSGSSYSSWSGVGSGSAPTNSIWQKENFAVPSAALTSTNFKIRFRYTTDGSNNYNGWYIDSLAITGLPNLTYTWSDGTNTVGTTNPLTYSPTNTGNTAITNAYTIQGTDANGCSVTSSPAVNVTVNPAQKITLTSGTGSDAQSVCSGNNLTSITYSVTGGGTGASITGGNLPSGITGSYSGGVFTIIGSTTVSATTTYNYTITTTGTCTAATASGTITVNPLPAVFNLTSGSFAVCYDGTNAPDLTLDGSEVNVTYQLLRGGSTVVITKTGTGSAIDFGTQSIAGTYTAKAINPSGIGSCPRNMGGSATITVAAQITAYNVTGTGTTCGQGTVTLSGSQLNVTYFLLGGATTVSQAGTGNPLNFAVTSSGTYSMYAQAGACTNGMNGNATITINPVPVITGTNTASICSGSPFSVAPTSSVSGTNYTWTTPTYTGSVSGGAAQTTGQSTISGTLSNAGINSGTATYTVTPATSTCTGSTFTVTVTVAATLANTSISATSPICSGSGTTVVFSGAANSTVYYTANGGSQQNVVLNASGNYSLTIPSLTTTTTYALVSATSGSNSSCTQSISGSATVTVTPLPTVAAISGPGNVGIGKNINLTDATTGGVWSSSDPSSATVNTSGKVHGVAAGAPVISYTVTNSGTGCSNSATQIVNVYDASIDNYITVADGNFSNVGIWNVNHNNSGYVAADSIPGNNDNIQIKHNVILDTSFNGLSTSSFVINYHLNNTDTVRGTLTIAPNHYFASAGGVNFNSNSVTVQSTAAGNGAIGQITGTSIITGADHVTVERYTDGGNSSIGKRAWRLITSPVTGASINAAWQEGQVYNSSATPATNYYTGTTNPATISNTYGTLITSDISTPSIANTNGYDFTGGVASLKQYTPGVTSGSWVSLADNQSTTNPKAGTLQDVRIQPAYMLFVRGNRTIGTTGSTVTTLRATGTVNQGSQIIGVIHTGGNIREVAGNPYPSAIDFNTVHSQNSTLIQDKFAVWVSRLGSFGAYTYIAGNGDGTYTATPFSIDGTGGGQTVNPANDRYIQSGEGFLVYPVGSVSSNTNITITEAAKAPIQQATATTTTFRLSPSTDKKLYVNLNLKDSDTSATLADGFLVRFDATYDAAINEDDGTKQSNFNENLGILSSGTSLIVEARPDVVKTDTLHMNLWNVKQRAYQLQLKGDNWTSAPGVHAYLVDNYLATKQEVSLAGSLTTVNFAVNSDSASWKSDRFSIVFQNNSEVLPVTITSIKAAAQNSGVNVSWTVTNEQNIKTYTVERSTNGGTSYTAIGSQAAKNATGAAITNYQSFDATPQIGSNMYRIRIEMKEGAVTYSSVVTVVIGQDNGKILITLYPNPVRPNGKVSLQMTNLATGTYLVNVYSQAGQTVYQKKITIGQPNTTQSEELRLGSSLAQGSYEVRISNSKGAIVYADKLVVGR